MSTCLLFHKFFFLLLLSLGAFAIAPSRFNFFFLLVKSISVMVAFAIKIAWAEIFFFEKQTTLHSLFFLFFAAILSFVCFHVSLSYCIPTCACVIFPSFSLIFLSFSNVIHLLFFCFFLRLPFFHSVCILFPFYISLLPCQQYLEYADIFPFRRVRPPPLKKGCPADNISLHLIRLQFWKYGNVE